jgi:zinc/manganese transport system substrate-binding protein
MRCSPWIALAGAACFFTACGSDASESSTSSVAETVVSDDSLTPTTDGSEIQESQNQESENLPVVAVTYSAVESIVSDIVGDLARVVVVVPNGTDPHDFEPSAKDVELLASASLVVANGLDLEEGLEDALTEAEQAGTPVFHLTDHVTLREGGDDGHDHGSEEKEEKEEEGDSHDSHGAQDPHVWLDPMTLAEAIPALAEELSAAVGADLTEQGEAVATDLGVLSASIEAKVGSLEKCVLITGHDSLGYFGARYGCEVLGSIVPSFSSAAEASAGDLAEIKTLAEAEQVKAVFTELGTPKGVAEQLAKELGIDVVELAHHFVPENGGYEEMMSILADSIVSALS